MTELRREGKRVGVLAVDPSSPFSGGALLGDRVRMQDHALDKRRLHPLDGLARPPRRAGVDDAAGAAGARRRRLRRVLVETVGVGQSEVEIAGLADTTLVLLAPGMGDGIQAAKAGILEIGDIYVVNKADRDGADQVRRDLRSMLALAERPEGAWRPPIVKTVAAKGEGLDEVAAEIARHHDWLESSGELGRRGVPAGPATRSRRSPSPRCASAGATCTAAPSSTTSRPPSRRGRPTRTPRPTSCSRHGSSDA